MKKITSYIMFAIATLLVVVACKKNNAVVDQDIVPPSFVKFNNVLLADSVKTYYIKSTNDPLKIPVGVTTISDKPRTINFTYTSRTAVAGQQYNAPATITIPAGKAVDSLTLSGLFAGYPNSSRIDTLRITITGGDVPVNDYGKSYTVYLRKYCDVFSADLTGSFTRSTDTYGGSASTKPNYTATVSDWTPVSATSATVIIKNMGATSDNGWGPFSPTDGSLNPGIKATLDWSNPAAFKVTIATQNYFNDGSGNSTIVSTTGTFSACDQTFTIPFTVKYAGNGSNYTTVAYLRR